MCVVQIDVSSSPKENNQPTSNDECSSHIHGQCRENVEEDKVSNLEYHEQSRDVYPSDGGEFDRSQVERGTVERKQDGASEKERDPRWQRRMMEGNSYSSIARRFKYGRGKHEQEDPHALCSQALKEGASKTAPSNYSVHDAFRY